MIFNQTILIEILTIYVVWTAIGTYTAKLFYNKFDKEYKDNLTFKRVDDYRYETIFLFSLIWPVIWFLFISCFTFYSVRSFINHYTKKSDIAPDIFLHKVMDNERYIYFKESIRVSDDGFMAFIHCIDTKNTSIKNGAICVFSRRNNNLEWELFDTIESHEDIIIPNEFINMSISGDGNVLITRTLSELNKVHDIFTIYKLTDNKFEVDFQLHYSIESGLASNYLSTDISKDGRTVVIGMNNGENGVVYIYRKNDDGSWLHMPALSCSLFSDRSFMDNFGFSLALSSDGETLVVGCPNTKVDTIKNMYFGYIFIYKLYKDEYYEEVDMFNSSLLKTNSNYGYSLDISDDGRTIVVGSPIFSKSDTMVKFTESNSLAVYHLDNDSWTNIQPVKLVPSKKSNLDSLGIDVKISGDGFTIVGTSSFSDGKGLRYIEHFIFNKYQYEWKYTDSIKNYFPYRDELPSVSTQLTDDGEGLVIGFSRDNLNEPDALFKAYTLSQ